MTQIKNNMKNKTIPLTEYAVNELNKFYLDLETLYDNLNQSLRGEAREKSRFCFEDILKMRRKIINLKVQLNKKND